MSDGFDKFSVKAPARGYVGVDELAARMGVTTHVAEGDGSHVLIVGKRGEYDLFALIEAVLDRVGAA